MRTADEIPQSKPSSAPVEPVDPVGAPNPAASQRPAAAGLLRLALIAFGVLAVFALKEVVFWDPPLTFTVGAEAESGVLHDWESAPDDASLPLRFSDGTVVTLQPRARARVVALGRTGAQIVIESGRARVDVQAARFRVPGESAWRVRVGPFSLETEGAHFELGWEPRADAFGLGVMEGSVDVSGCDRRSQTIGPGQGLGASCSTRRWALGSAADALASIPSEAESSTALAPPAAPMQPLPGATAPSVR
jgi:hypothetical protein